MCPDASLADRARGERPLAGLRVLELASLIAGPFATRVMAEFGAEVIKIERPDSPDPLRTWRYVDPRTGTSLWWAVQSRNKRLVTLDVGKPDGLALAKRLAAESDIVVENFKPGTLEKLGLGWDLYAVIGALMAVHARDSLGGPGQVVDVALYEAVFSLMESMVPEFDVAGIVRERTGAALPGITPSNSYLTGDGSSVPSEEVRRRLAEAHVPTGQRVHLATPDKITLIETLAAAGVGRFEASSFVSPKAIPQLADAEDVFAGLGPREDVVYGALIGNERGYDRALAAGVPEVVIVDSATEGYGRKNLNRSVDEILASFAPVAERGRADGIRVRANLSTCFGDPYDGPTDPEQVLRVLARVVEAGITDVTLSDTIGVAHPRQVHEMFVRVREAHPEVAFGAHFHDTRGLALADVVAALDAGIGTFDSSIGGMGGSPFAPDAGGNVATEDLVHMLTGMGIRTGVDVERLLDAAELVEGPVGHPLHARLDRELVVVR